MFTSVYQYADGTLKQNLSEEELRGVVRDGTGMLWLDIFKPNADEIFMLDEVFGFHPLAIEDCQHASAYPKLDDFGNHLFIVFLVPNPRFDPLKPRPEGETPAETEEPVEELDIFLGKNYAVTIHRTPLPFLQTLAERAKRNPKASLERGSAFLVHDIMDAAVDQFFVMVEKLQKQAEGLEQHLQSDSDDELQLSSAFDLKREVLNLRRQMSDHRELILRLLRGRNPIVKKKAVIYFRNILDHLNRIVDDLNICIDTLNSARDVHLAMANMRTNQVVKVLTVVFTLSLPFTIATSWYGMNFKSLPLDDHPAGPLVLSVATTVFAGLLYYWLRKRRFL
ncbi:MAG: magnesium transport protein CorA [Planctomycetota bacterium]